MGTLKHPDGMNRYELQRRPMQRALNALTVASTHPAQLSLYDVQALLAIMLTNNLAKPSDMLQCEAVIWRHVFGGEAVMAVQSFNKLTLKLSTYSYRKNNGDKATGAGLIDKSREADDNRSAVAPIVTAKGQKFLDDFLRSLNAAHVPEHIRP